MKIPERVPILFLRTASFSVELENTINIINEEHKYNHN